jgi:hypothetical protein
MRCQLSERTESRIVWYSLQDAFMHALIARTADRTAKGKHIAAETALPSLTGRIVTRASIQYRPCSGRPTGAYPVW